jgi:hypothetical protein
VLAEHLPELIEKLVSRAKAGDEFAIKLILERVAPPLRPQGQRVVLPRVEVARGTVAKAEAVLEALGAGEVPVETGRSLLEAIATVARITEIHDLLRRVETLEEKKGKGPWV